MRLGTWYTIALAILGFGGSLSAQEVQVAVSNDYFTLRNAALERRVQWRPQLRTTSIKNLGTGREFSVDSEEFGLILDDGKLDLSAKDFIVTGSPVVTNLPDGGKQVRCRVANEQHGVKAEVCYAIGKSTDFWVRKWIEIDAGKHLVRRIDVERFKFLPDAGGAVALKKFDPLPKPLFSGWGPPVGRPLYAGRQMFLGLEYPAGRNACDAEGQVTLSHFPGRTGPLTSRAAVIGVAPDQTGARVNDKFQEYLDQIRVRPVKRHVQWIAYFQPSMADEYALMKIQYARKTFFERGVRLDCVLMDSGWTDPQSIMGLSQVRPDRPGQIRDFARKYLDTGLGLHVITSGSKPMVDKDWLAAQGYDMISHAGPRSGAYCLGDPRIEEVFEANLLRYIKDYNIVAYKFDWGQFTCAAAGHRGHLAGPEYGLEANTDNYIKALQAFRRANPDIFLYNTGWYSPWWLMYYDAVFSAGADYNFNLDAPPTFATCTAIGTWRDAVVRFNLVLSCPFFPLSSLMHHCPTSYGWENFEVRYQDPLDQFAGHILMAYLRGSQMTEIGLNIAALTDAHRDVLAGIMNWAARHDDILLASTRYLGGDPMKGEVYGYAHFARDGRGLIGLKNPHVIPQKFEVQFGEACGLPPTKDQYALHVIYPYRSGLAQNLAWGASVPVALEGHEVLVIEAVPRDATPFAPRVAGGKLPGIQKAQIKAAATTIQGSFEISVPADVSAAVVLLAERSNLTATIAINGQAVLVEAPHIQVEDSKAPARTYGGQVAPQRAAKGLTIKGPWSLFRASLPPGASAVQFNVACRDLDAIQVPEGLEIGKALAPGMAEVPFRCMIQTTQDLAPAPAAAPLTELPNRWANVLRRTLDVAPPATLKLESPRRFECYTVQPGARLFMDADATITRIPPALAGRRGLRIPKAQAAQDAALVLDLSKAMRLVAAFGKPDGASGYLAPPPGWRRCLEGAVQTSDPLLDPGLYVCDLPKGTVALFSGLPGAFAILAFIENEQSATNLALKCSVTAQSGFPGHDVATAVTDGNIGTQWWSANGLPQWVQVDLGQAQNINGVRPIFYCEDHRYYQYRIDTSVDGQAWQPAYDAANNKMPSTEVGYRCDFTRRPARYVRVTVTGCNSAAAAHICEIEVFDDRFELE